MSRAAEPEPVLEVGGAAQDDLHSPGQFGRLAVIGLVVDDLELDELVDPLNAGRELVGTGQINPSLGAQELTVEIGRLQPAGVRDDQLTNACHCQRQRRGTANPANPRDQSGGRLQSLLSLRRKNSRPDLPFVASLLFH